MFKFLAICAALALAGCAGLSSYKPFVIDITDAGALTKDQNDCLAIAQTYRSPISIGSIGTAAVEGGGNNLAGGALNPLVPALGAAGGASAELLKDIDLLGSQQRRVFLLCLDHRGERSHAYSVVDPNL